MDLTFITGFLIGLFGVTHCFGMCGGIVGALNTGMAPAGRTLGMQAMHHLTYNSGRILSYVASGTIAGMVGSLAANAAFGTPVPVGRFIAGLLMIALGLYLAGWWNAIVLFERIGYRLWKTIEPIGRQLYPANTPTRTFALGLLWGWLPCGLVYSALALSVASASPVQGAWIMFGFGLGTLPGLLAFGFAANQFIGYVRHPFIRLASGICVIIFGIYTCYVALSGQVHHHAASSRDTGMREMSAECCRIGQGTLCAWEKRLL